MAAGLSIYYANLLVNKALNTQDFSPPGAMYVALFTDPSAATHLRNNDIASAAEVPGNGYQRVEILGASGISFSQAVNGSSDQSSDILFPAALGPWGTIYATAVIDAPGAGGNVLFYDDWDTPESIETPDAPRIPAGALIVSM